MPELKHAITDRHIGDFKPKFKRPGQIDFMLRLEHQGNEHGLHRIFSPHCAFTTNVAKLGDGNQEYITNWLIRTAPGFDGGVVDEPRTGIAIFNADCPVVILLDKVRGCLAMLHAGFRCLVPKDPRTPNIIEMAFKKPGLNPLSVEAFIGFGAGPCCYGIWHPDEIFSQEEQQLIKDLDAKDGTNSLEIIIKGPRKGKLAVDLSSMAKTILINCGVSADSIRNIGPKCTACEGRENDSKGKYHSNIYGDSGRNLVMAWFTNR